ncbi:MAG: carbon-nitrogen hydrolase family protein [Clostridia bacterium]|nr:carbon-nitrogen hydrolase family protein [Clostridia bacterium]
MKVSLIQMKTSGGKESRLERARELALSAAGSDFIMLPEMFCCPYSSASFVENAEEEGGPVTEALSSIARETGAVLIGGSMPELDRGRIYNTCFVYGPGGERLAKHRKAHLFDIDVAGGQRFFESDTLSAGDGPTVFDTPHGRAGVCVCFDIRFPELICAMRGAELLFVPAAFNMTTGPLHWELLFRARAVDLQAFAFGCAPAREPGAGYVSYANSIAVSPWGRVIARAGEDECVLTAEFDIAEAARAREQIPVGNPVPVKR